MKGRFFVGCLILILMAGSILLWYPTSPNTQTTASSFSQKSITIPILDQDCFTFTARSLEEYLHLEENTLQAITITALPEDNAETHVFHAGTALDDEGLTIVSGGRVLCVVGLGDTVKAAQERAYEAAHQVKFDGMQMRSDIGYRAIGR